MHNKPDLLTAKEVSILLRVHVRTVQRLSKRGKIHAVRIGDQWRYKISDIEKYRDNGTDSLNSSDRKITTPTFQFQKDKLFIERRKYPRINTNFDCHYSIILPPFRNINSSGIIKNLSAGGVFIYTNNNAYNSLNSDDPIDLNFNIINNDKMIDITAKGRIIRKTKEGIGVIFRNIPKSTREIITKYIN